MARKPQTRGWKARFRSLARHTVALFAVPLLSAGLTYLIASHTRIGAGLQELSYATTQHRLARASFDKPLGVAVIDISGLPRHGSLDVGAGLSDCYRFRQCITDRDSLLALVRTVANQQPQAIGIDIDFSPDSGWIDPIRDPSFLYELSQIRSPTGIHIPVFVVAGRAAASGSDEWLGTPEFAHLAAAATRSRTDPRAPFTLWQTSSVSKERLCSMPAQLNQMCNSASRRLWPDLLFPKLDDFEECTAAQTCIEGEEFYVDYSRLHSIEAEMYSAWRAEQITVKNLADKMVLLGFAARQAPIDDRVSVPGRDADIPGVVALAAATQTLMDDGLRIPTETANILLDVAFALLVLAVAHTSARVFARRRGGKPIELDHRRIAQAQQLAWPIVIAIIAFVFVAQTRIIWGDFLISVPILMFFLWAEPRAAADWSRFNSFMQRVFGKKPTKLRKRRAARALMFAALTLAATARADAQRADTAAIVDRNGCQAVVRSARGAVVKQASEKSVLYHGDSIRCNRPGQMQLKIRRLGGSYVAITLDASRGTYIAIAPPNATLRAARRASELRPMVAQPRGGNEVDALRSALVAVRREGVHVAMQGDVGAHAALAELRAAAGRYPALRLIDDVDSADILVDVSAAPNPDAVVLRAVHRATLMGSPSMSITARDTAAIAEAVDWLVLMARNHWLLSIASSATTDEIVVDHLRIPGKQPGDVANEWYERCAGGAAHTTSPISEPRVSLPADDLLGFRVANSSARNRFYYVLHLAADGRLTVLSPANNASAVVAAAGTRCLTVAQVGTTTGEEHFFVFVAAEPLPSLPELLGLTVPVWLLAPPAPPSAQTHDPLVARLILVTTGGHP